MVGYLIATLRSSPLVTALEVIEVVEEESVQFLQARAEMRDGSVLYVREAIFPHQSKYSYHWQAKTGELLLRWDNAPHHPQISTHPDHKHVGAEVLPSNRISIEDVLSTITAQVEADKSNRKT